MFKQNKISRRTRLVVFALCLSATSGLAVTNRRVGAQTGAQVGAQTAAQSASASSRPQYRIAASIDYDLLTLKSTASVQIPASGADPLDNAVFFLYANASGVGGDDERRKNLVVDSVSLEGGAALPWTLRGAVLRVKLPAPQKAPFALRVNYHGIVPRSPKDEGGLSSMMGGALTSDISGLLGLGGAQGGAQGAAQTVPEKPKNTDYGLYAYGNSILSLGSFWYPALAVRQNGKWADDAPEGLGDVAYSEKSDFAVQLRAPKDVVLVAPGQITRSVSGQEQIFGITARDTREFAVLMSEDFVQKARVFPVAGRSVTVSATLLKPHADKLDKTLDVAGAALQIFSRRFGAYPFPEFKIVEAPMKNGAGGMEYSRMIGVASMLYGDLGQQLGGMVSSVNLPGADKLLESLGDDSTLKAGTSAPEGAPSEEESGGLGAGGASAMLGGILGQQKEMWDSILETTIAHEVAHQWWAIGVGSDSQRHPFVDESLTNWSAMLYFEDRYGRATAQQMMDLHLKTSFSMGASLGGGDKPANLPTSAYTNNLQYGAVIYGKGALFYDELRKVIGDAAFFTALQRYFSTWNDRIAGPDSLRSVMVAVASAKRRQIDALYKRWIEEAHGQEDIGGGLNLDLGGILGGLMGGMGDVGE